MEEGLMSRLSVLIQGFPCRLCLTSLLFTSTTSTPLYGELVSSLYLLNSHCFQPVRTDCAILQSEKTANAAGFSGFGRESGVRVYSVLFGLRIPAVLLCQGILRPLA